MFASSSSLSPFSRRTFVVRAAIAGSLIAAAILKVSTAESAILLRAYNVPFWLLTIVVQIEVLLAVLLIVGAWPKQTVIATILTFALFAAFSFYRAAAGYEACGCFGPLEINPWWTFALDVAVCALLATQVRPVRRGTTLRRAALATACYAAIGLPVAAFAISNAGLAGNPGLIKRDGLIILDPQAWVGKPLPIAEAIRPQIDLSTGEWILLIYHHDCPNCERVRPLYEALSRIGKAQVLLIESPPFGRHGPVDISISRHASLTDENGWFVQTPVEIRLKSGTVVSASLELPSIDQQEQVSVLREIRRRI